MQKPIITLLAVSFITMGTAFAQGEKVYSIVKQRRTAEWYVEQANAWKDYLQLNPSDGDAWLNYYTAMRMQKFSAGSTVNDSILGLVVDDIEAAIPNSFEYNYIRHWNDGYRTYPESLKYLRKAYEMQPDRPELYDDLLGEYIIKGDVENAKKIATSWFVSNDISPGLLSWNYNALQSTEQNAILITVGDNDTYPAWVLQLHHGVRADVAVMNASLLVLDRYREQMFKELGIPQMEQTLDDVKDYHKYQMMIFQHIKKQLPNRPFYFASSASPKMLIDMKDDLYNVGMAQRWSDEKFDNIAVIRRNYEKRFLLDYLKVDMSSDISQAVVDHMNTNYLVSMLTLHNHYLESEDPKKVALEALIKMIAKRADMVEDVDKLLKDNC